MGFYITTFLLGGLVAGNASHARADQPKPADKANVNADNTKQNAEDRQRVFDLATAVAGAVNVTNELDVIKK